MLWDYHHTRLQCLEKWNISTRCHAKAFSDCGPCDWYDIGCQQSSRLTVHLDQRGCQAQFSCQRQDSKQYIHIRVVCAHQPGSTPLWWGFRRALRGDLRRKPHCWLPIKSSRPWQWSDCHESAAWRGINLRFHIKSWVLHHITQS